MNNTTNATTPAAAPTPTVTGNILVHYSTHRAGLSVTHNRLTRDNCNVTGADKKALRTVAQIFEAKGTPVGEILSLFASTRIEVARLGLRLSTGGYLVRASNLEKVRAIFDDADDKLERLRGELRRQYPELLAKSKARLGGAAADLEFPTAESAAGRFTHRLDYVPDPTAGEVVLDGVADEVAAKVRAQVEQTKRALLEDAHSNLVKELLGFLTGTSETDQGILGVLGSDCVVKKSRFERLKQRLEEAKALNYLDLPGVNTAIEALRPIAEADLDVIRVDENARRDLSVKAKAAVESVTKNSLAAIGIAL